MRRWWCPGQDPSGGEWGWARESLVGEGKDMKSIGDPFQEFFCKRDASQRVVGKADLCFQDGINNGLFACCWEWLSRERKYSDAEEKIKNPWSHILGGARGDESRWTGGLTGLAQEHRSLVCNNGWMGTRVRGHGWCWVGSYDGVGSSSDSFRFLSQRENTTISGD